MANDAARHISPEGSPRWRWSSASSRRRDLGTEAIDRRAGDAVASGKSDSAEGPIHATAMDEDHSLRPSRPGRSLREGGAGALWRSRSLVPGRSVRAAPRRWPPKEAEFGQPGSGRGEGRAAYPQLRAVGLAECGTHAICDVALGPIKRGEGSLAAQLWGSLVPVMLLLADRGFWDFKAFKAAKASRAELLWRVRKNLILPVHEVL